MRIWRGVLLLLFTALPAFANDATFGGAGADLVPMSEPRVQMQSEDIRITYDGGWSVEADYVFYNHSSSAASVQVGFPEYRCLDADMDCANAAFQGLQTWVDGKPVKHRQGKLDKSHKWASLLGVVWLFDVDFPPNKPLKISHKYRVQSGNDMMWNHFTTYVTRTGARWAGKIGEATFTLKLPPQTHSVTPPEGITQRGIQTVMADEPYVEVKYSEKNWVPKTDLNFSFNASAELAMSRFPKTLPENAKFSKADLCPQLPPDFEALTASQRQMCKNVIYASQGYPFKRADLNAYFYSQGAQWHLAPEPYAKSKWWVRGLRPFPSFRESWIGEPEKEWLKLLAQTPTRDPVNTAQEKRATKTKVDESAVGHAPDTTPKTRASESGSASTARSELPGAQLPNRAAPKTSQTGCSIADLGRWATPGNTGPLCLLSLLLIGLRRRRSFVV